MKDKIDLSKKDEKIKKESAFIDLLTMEINKKIIGQKKRKSIDYNFSNGSI